MTDKPDTREPAVQRLPPPPISEARRFLSWSLPALVSLYADFVQRLLPRNSASRAVTTPSEALARRAGFLEKLSEILLMVASATTALLTYAGVVDGMSESGATLIKKGEAVLFAVTVGVLSFLGWKFLFSLVSWLHGRYLGVGALAAIAFLGCIAAIDTNFNVIGLAGPTAERKSIERMVGYYQQKAEELSARVTALQRLIPVLVAEATRFQQRRERELKGSGTGKPGSGAVSDTYGDVTLLIGTTTKGLTEGLNAATALNEKIVSEMGTLRSTMYRQGPMRPRIEAAANSADRLDNLLGELARLDFTASLKAATAILENIVPPSPKLAGSPLEKAQHAELQRIAGMVKPVAEALRVALAEIPVAGPLTGRPPRPIEASIAVREFWVELLPSWISAAMISFGPGLLVVMLVAARREADSLALRQRVNPERTPS